VEGLAVGVALFVLLNPLAGDHAYDPDAPEAVSNTLLPLQNEAGEGLTLTVGAAQGVNV